MVYILLTIGLQLFSIIARGYTLAIIFEKLIVPFLNVHYPNNIQNLPLFICCSVFIIVDLFENPTLPKEKTPEEINNFLTHKITLKIVLLIQTISVILITYLINFMFL